ncbi:hypothetical protein Lal_00032604 [Lupinus albus]|nr:hypothetical protein Lal_00032604 [Lupinus albus]
MDPTISQSILWMETTMDIWQDLKEIYHLRDIYRIYELLGEIHTYKQGDLGIGAYFSHIKGNHKEHDYVICFLKGLNDRYESVRSQIMLMDPLPTFNKAFSLLTQQERHLQSHNSDPKILMNGSENGYNRSDDGFNTNISDVYNSNMGRGRGRNNLNGIGRGQYTQGRNNNYAERSNNGTGSKMCTYCNRNGHTIYQCYKKHDFPPGYFKNNNLNNITSMQEFAHNKETNSENKDNGNVTEHQSNHMVNNLSANLDNSQGKGNMHQFAHLGMSLEWVLDTGATDHVCHTLSLYQTFKHIKPIVVTLPNENQIKASISGSISLSKNLILTDDTPSLRMIVADKQQIIQPSIFFQELNLNLRGNLLSH